MALQQLFLPAVLARNQNNIDDSRNIQYDGYFGRVVPDVDRSHYELTRLNSQIATAANLIALSATNVVATRRPENVVANKPVQLIRHEEMNQDDMVYLDSIASGGLGSPAVRARLLEFAQGIQERNLQGIRIRRAWLASCMVVGEVAYDKFGFKIDNTTFSRPATMTATPSVYWRTSAGVPNATATPLTDVLALDQAAGIIGNTPFTVIGMSQAAYTAMTQSTEYKNAAAGLAAVFSTANLPNAISPGGYALASVVLGKRIEILDQTFQEEAADGTLSTTRYIPERLAVLWRAADENNSGNWEVSNCPLTKSMLANASGYNAAFGGQTVRGPVSWGSVETRELTNAALYTAQECIPVRKSLAVSAVIETRGG